LQEDKEAVFDSVDSVNLILPVVTAIIKTLKLNPDKMRAALGEDMLATDLADYLVLKGMPFRQAHHVVGQVVRLAAARDGKLSELPLEELRKLSDLFTDNVATVFEFEVSVSRRGTAGGTAPEAVESQIEAAKAALIRLK